MNGFCETCGVEIAPSDACTSMVIEPGEGRVTLCWSCYEDRDDTHAGTSSDDSEIESEQDADASPAIGQTDLEVWA